MRTPKAPGYFCKWCVLKGSLTFFLPEPPNKNHRGQDSPILKTRKLGLRNILTLTRSQSMLMVVIGLKSVN